MKILLLLLLLSACSKENKIEVVYTSELWECEKKPMKIIMPSTFKSKDYPNNIYCRKRVLNEISINGDIVDSISYPESFEVLLQESKLNTGYDSLPSKTTGDRSVGLYFFKDVE